jgi:hypothetical protein
MQDDNKLWAQLVTSTGAPEPVFKVPAGTGSMLLCPLPYVTLSAAKQADTSSHQGESSQMLE